MDKKVILTLSGSFNFRRFNIPVALFFLGLYFSYMYSKTRCKSPTARDLGCFKPNMFQKQTAGLKLGCFLTGLKYSDFVFF